MSEIEHQKGKLTEIKPQNGEELQDLAKRILTEKNIKVEDYWGGDYVAALQDECEEIVEAQGKLYQCEVTDIDPYQNMFIATENPDGTLNFEVKYYNGSCSLAEGIRNAIERM